MTKSNLFIIIFPFLLNFLILMIMKIPMKKMKFHPMILMFMLILISIFMSKKMNLMYKSWMPFIIFLTIIGGLMIIYMYITSLANNEFMEMKMTNLINFIMKMMLIMTPLLLLMLNFYMFNNNQESWNLIFLMEKKNELNFTEMYNLNYNSIMILMLYLFMSMICIMNICYKSNSPLRQLFFYE